MQHSPEQTAGAAHTPGPWLADFHNERREGGRFITMVNGGNQLVPIAAVPSGVEGFGREEGRANASLIAAAPDLLEALEAIVAKLGKASADGPGHSHTVPGIWDNDGSNGERGGKPCEWCAQWAAAKAAIAKARGQ